MPSPAGTCPDRREPEDRRGTVERVCADDQPFSARVFKTMADPFVGKLILMKVMSGALTGDIAAVQRQRGKDRKARHHLHPEGQEADAPPTKVCAGDICALAKLQSVATGNTLCDGSNPVKFAELEFPAPCISKAVYAKKAGEEDKIFSGLSAPDGRRSHHHALTRTWKPPNPCCPAWARCTSRSSPSKLASKFGAECVLQDPEDPVSRVHPQADRR